MKKLFLAIFAISGFLFSSNIQAEVKIEKSADGKIMVYEKVGEILPGPTEIDPETTYKMWMGEIKKFYIVDFPKITFFLDFPVVSQIITPVKVVTYSDKDGWQKTPYSPPAKFVKSHWLTAILFLPVLCIFLSGLSIERSKMNTLHKGDIYLVIFCAAIAGGLAQKFLFFPIDIAAGIFFGGILCFIVIMVLRSEISSFSFASITLAGYIIGGLAVLFREDGFSQYLFFILFVELLTYLFLHRCAPEKA